MNTEERAEWEGFFDEEWKSAAKAKGIDGEAALKYFRDEAAAYAKTGK